MAVKTYYVSPEERRQIRREAVRWAMDRIDGPVGFYEHLLGEEASIWITDEALQCWRPFCNLVWEEEHRKRLCREDYIRRASACTDPQITICWLGVHNLACPVEADYGGGVTLLGGEFHVRERMTEANELVERFLKDMSSENREVFRTAWNQIPTVTEEDVFGYIMRELKLVGMHYLNALVQRSEFLYSADLATHDVVIALQALIADIEVLKIELTDTFGIGRKWQNRFEKLIRDCENHHLSLETRLELDQSKYAYHSISRLIYECVDLYRPKAKQRGIGFEVDLEQITDDKGEHKVLTVRMDRIALRQALRNVIDNAVKYSFFGTAEYPRWIDVIGRLQTVEDTPGYSIVVRNLGIGIEEDELELVFEPHYQGRRRHDEDRSGHGMGLNYVKECIESHGGSVTIHSRPSRRTGWLTTLSIWLPIQGPTR